MRRRADLPTRRHRVTAATILLLFVRNLLVAVAATAILLHVYRPDGVGLEGLSLQPDHVQLHVAPRGAAGP